MPKITTNHAITYTNTIFELNKSSWRERDQKKAKGSPYMLPLITVDLQTQIRFSHFELRKIIIIQKICDDMCFYTLIQSLT